MKSFSRSTRIALLAAAVLALFVGVAGAGDCPWDCQPAPNGSVDVPDLLTLLSQWGTPGWPRVGHVLGKWEMSAQTQRRIVR